MGWTFPHPNGSLGFLSQPLFPKTNFFPFPKEKNEDFVFWERGWGRTTSSERSFPLCCHTAHGEARSSDGLIVEREFPSPVGDGWAPLLCGEDGDCQPQEPGGFGSALRQHLACPGVLLKPGYSDLSSPCCWKIPVSCYPLFSPSGPQRNPWIPSPSPKVPTDKQMYCKRDPAAKTLLFYFELSLVELSSY